MRTPHLRTFEIVPDWDLGPELINHLERELPGNTAINLAREFEVADDADFANLLLSEYTEQGKRARGVRLLTALHPERN